MGHQIQEFKTHMHPHRVNGEITFMMSIIFRDPFRIYDIMSYHHHISFQHKLAMTFLLFNNIH